MAGFTRSKINRLDHTTLRPHIQIFLIKSSDHHLLPQPTLAFCSLWYPQLEPFCCFCLTLFCGGQSSSLLCFRCWAGLAQEKKREVTTQSLHNSWAEHCTAACPSPFHFSTQRDTDAFLLPLSHSHILPPTWILPLDDLYVLQAVIACKRWHAPKMTWQLLLFRAVRFGVVLACKLARAAQLGWRQLAVYCHFTVWWQFNLILSKNSNNHAMLLAAHMNCLVKKIKNCYIYKNCVSYICPNKRNKNNLKKINLTLN